MPTCRPRALRIVPIEAAVIPLPSEETTPPVTNTNFAMRRASRESFSDCISRVAKARTDVRRRPSAGPRLEEDDPRLVAFPARSGEDETRLWFPGAFGKPHLLGELAHRVELAAVAGAEAGRHHDARLHGVHELCRLDGSERVATADGDDQDVDVAEAVDLVLGELAPEASRGDDTDVVDRNAHDRRLAGREAENPDPADLELTRSTDLLELTVARTKLRRVGNPFGADDDAAGAFGEPGESRLRWVDDDGHVPAAKPDAREAVIGQFHESPVCRLGAIRRSRRSSAASSTSRSGRR